MTEYERKVDYTRGRVVHYARKLCKDPSFSGDPRIDALQDAVDAFDRLTALVGEGKMEIRMSSLGNG